MRQVTAREERAFGLSVGGVLALLAVYFLLRGRTPAGLILGVVAATLVLPALIRPSLLRLPNRAWRTLAHRLGWLNARILLSALFFLVLTPLGLVFRLAGRDPLGRCRHTGGSGWVPYPARQRDPRHYERMY